MVLGLAITNKTLFYLAWPPSPARVEAAVTQAVSLFVAWAWETRELAPPLLPPDLKVRVDLAAEASPFPSLF